MRGWLWFDSFRAGTTPDGRISGTAERPSTSTTRRSPHILQGLARVPAIRALHGGEGTGLDLPRRGRDRFRALLRARAQGPARRPARRTLYALSPVIHAAWILEGGLPGVLLLAIVPWAFVAVERIATGIGGVRAGCALAIAIGGIVIAQATEARSVLTLLCRLPAPSSGPHARHARLAGAFDRGVADRPDRRGRARRGVPRADVCENRPSSSGSTGTASRDSPSASLTSGQIGGALRWRPTGEGYIGITVAILAVGGIVRASWTGEREDGESGRFRSRSSRSCRSASPPGRTEVSGSRRFPS